LQFLFVISSSRRSRPDAFTEVGEIWSPKGQFKVEILYND